MESKTCTVDGCENKLLAKGYCRKHYKQMRKHGRLLDRTIYDRNKYIKQEDFYITQCFDKSGNVIAEVMIDVEYYEKVNDKKWTYLQIGYVYCTSENTYLHRFLMKDLDIKDKTIDHTNRNKLDNRKENLRILTKGENLINKGLQNNNTSGVRGVRIRTLKSGTIRYEARISYKGKEVYLGRFKTLEKAKEVRKQKEKEIFGGDLIYEK